MSFNLIQVFHEMGPFALVIVAALAIMALATLSVFIERLWVFYRSRKQSRAFAHKAANLLEARQHDGLLDAARSHKGSHLASLMASGMKAYVNGVQKPGEVAPVELARREMERQTEVVSADVRRGFNLLASVGSTAPFVGLLGTVVGIITAFQGIAREGSGGLGAVSAGIAEALVVTALGLVVAIPAVLLFNYLNGRADKLLLAIDQARGQFLDHLENHGPSNGTRREPHRHLETIPSASA